jgi:ABC-type Zn2+ transport system substrate-binding protein/surface adhesin
MFITMTITNIVVTVIITIRAIATRLRTLCSKDHHHHHHVHHHDHHKHCRHCHHHHQGNRNEAAYIMFKGFLPKIAAIPASAIPIVRV